MMSSPLATIIKLPAVLAYVHLLLINYIFHVYTIYFVIWCWCVFGPLLQSILALLKLFGPQEWKWMSLSVTYTNAAKLPSASQCSWSRQGKASGGKQLDRGLNRLISYYHIDFFWSLSHSLPLCFSTSLWLTFIWSAVNSSSQWATVRSSGWEL